MLWEDIAHSKHQTLAMTVHASFYLGYKIHVTIPLVHVTLATPSLANLDDKKHAISILCAYI